MRRTIEFENEEYVAIVKLIMNLASAIEELPECETKLTLMGYRSKLFNAFNITQMRPY